MRKRSKIFFYLISLLYKTDYMVELTLDAWIHSATYKKNKRAILKVELNWLFKLPFLGLFFLFKKSCGGSKNRYPLLIEGIDSEYKESNLSDLLSFLEDVELKLIGENLDYPSIGYHILLKDSIRVMVGVFFIWPFVIMASVITKLPWATALGRSLVVYYSTIYYFTKYPCDVFFTTRDNRCTPEFYAGFKAAGGKYLCAAQNGLRGEGSGMKNFCLDHLFAISPDALERYLDSGGYIANADVVPPLQLDRYLNSCPNEPEEDIDLLIIDQGFPAPGVDLWEPSNTPENVGRFLDYVLEFSNTYMELKVVYLLRRYNGANAFMRNAINQWANDSNIELFEPDDLFESYRTIQRSRVVISMYSTMGVEALTLRKNVLFFNVSGNKSLNFCSSPYQYEDIDYIKFQDIINKVLCEGMEHDQSVINYYAPPVGLCASKLIAEKIIEYAYG